MSVLAEFRTTAGDVPLLDTLTSASDVEVTLDRIVPVNERTLPYVWVEGDCERFEEAMLADQNVESVSEETTTGERTLYRVEWSEDLHEMAAVLARSGFTLLAATGNHEGWQYRFRFPSHRSVSKFVDLCDDYDIEMELERISGLSDLEDERRLFELTPKQREALEMATRSGYYQGPREVTLSELADELDISQQALSQRLRRGVHKLVTHGLLEPQPAEQR